MKFRRKIGPKVRHVLTPAGSGRLSTGGPGAKRVQGRPRIDLKLEQYGVEWLLWKSFWNWLMKKRESPKGLPSRKELWDAVPNKKRYFNRLGIVAFFRPNYGGTASCLAEAYETAPNLTFEALFFLQTRARDLKVRNRHMIAIPDFSPDSKEKKLTPDAIALRRRMREGHADFNSRYGI